MEAEAFDCLLSLFELEVVPPCRLPFALAVQVVLVEAAVAGRSFLPRTRALDPTGGPPPHLGCLLPFFQALQRFKTSFTSFSPLAVL